MGTYFFDPVEEGSNIDGASYNFVSNLNIEGFEVVTNSEKTAVSQYIDNESSASKNDSMMS